MIYHITSRANWAEAKKPGHFSSPSLESEGFIHCSTRGQVLSVADSVFRGQTDLLLLCIDDKRLSAELRWEAPAHPPSLEAPPSQDESRFPHLYGPLNLDAVLVVFALEENEAGFTLPADLP